MTRFRARRISTPKTGIRSLVVGGFKSIGEEQRLDLAPLTVLAGVNSAGKSSFMQPLLLLKQTLEAAYDPGPLLLHGPCVRFTSIDQFMPHRPGISEDTVFSVEADSFQAFSVRMRYQKGNGKGLKIESMSFREEDGGQMYFASENMSENEIVSILPLPFREVGNKVLEETQRVFGWSVVRDRCFLEFIFRDRNTGEELGFFKGTGLSPAERIVPDILNIIHLPGLRGNPERSYRTTAIESRFPGTFEPYIASIVSHWQSQKSDQLKALGEDLRALGLTWKVAAKRIDDTQVELHVGRLPEPKQGGARDLVNIADVGFGMSQTLPVVVALRVASRGRLVYIEQPEIHLHPRAQAAMARLLVNAANRGVRVVIETHSAVLLRSIQTAVARGEIHHADVSLNWFERDPTTGLTAVNRADLDAAGTFGDWPEDFDDVMLDVEGAYLDAVEARIVG